MNTSLPLDAVITETSPNVTASVIWLHGLGADGHDFADIVPQLKLPSELGIRFIFPHAPVRPVTINNSIPMRAWYDIKNLSDLKQEDREGIYATHQMIQDFIDHEIQAGIAVNRIILAGFSQGGAMALFSGLRYPQSLAGILALSTYLPLAQQLATEAHSENANTPVFLAHGQQDEIIPLMLGEYTRDLLQKTGHTVDWQSYPMGHAVCLPEIQAIQQWLLKLLSK